MNGRRNVCYRLADGRAGGGREQSHPYILSSLGGRGRGPITMKGSARKKGILH
jgi:hypothetical protein